MGENEQGGMLRTIIVLGLVALIAGVVTAGIISLKDTNRREALTAATTPTNILDELEQHQLGDFGVKTKVVKNGDNDYIITLDGSDHGQGLYWGKGGSEATSEYTDFRPGDNWVMSTEARLISGPGEKVALDRLYFQGTDSYDWTKQPSKLTSDWQTFSTKGSRVRVWGAPALFFTNRSGQSVTVEVRNTTLHRTV